MGPGSGAGPEASRPRAPAPLPPCPGQGARRVRGRPRSAAGPHSPPRGLAASARRPGAGPCPSGAAAETSLRCHSCWGGTRRPYPAQLPPRRASPLPRGGGDSRRSYRGRGAGPGVGEAAGEPGPAAGGSAPAWPRFALPRAKHRAWGVLRFCGASSVCGGCKTGPPAAVWGGLALQK